MMKQIMIPVAAFALTVTGVSAFNSDMLEKLDIDLTSNQIEALEEAHELRVDGDKEGAKEVLEDAEIDREKMQEIREAIHEEREATRSAIKEAAEDEDYDDFKDAIEGTPLEDVINSESDFDKFVEAHDLRESGDKEGAREILDELGLERPEHKGFGGGKHGQRGGGDGQGGHGEKGFGAKN